MRTIKTKRTILAFGLASIIGIPIAIAQPLRHVISSQETATSWQSQRQCYSLLEKKDGLYCLPVNNFRVATGQIDFESSLNSNEDAFKVISRFSSKSIDQEFLTDLFRENSFQSVSGVVRFGAIYGETSFSLVPYHFAGAYRISNPSLPDVSYAAVTSSHLSLAHNFTSSASSTYSFLAAPGLSYSQKKAQTADFNLLDLTVTNRTSILKEETWNAPSASLAAGVIAKRSLYPSLTLRVNNVSLGKSCAFCRQGKIAIPDEIAPYGIATIGTYKDLAFGNLWLGLAGKYSGLTKKFDPTVSNFLAVYKLGGLDAFATFAPAIFGFGFMFDSNLYRIGIQYTDEKQNNALFIPRRKNSYVHLAFKV